MIEKGNLVLRKTTSEWSCGGLEDFRDNVVPPSSMEVRRHKHVRTGQIEEGYYREELVLGFIPRAK